MNRAMNRGTNRSTVKLVAGVAALLVVGFLVLGGASSGAPSSLAGCPTTGQRFGVMFDAGSTGSRVHAYEFNYHANGHVELIDELFEQVKPGLSSYKDSPADAAESLRGLLNAAVKRIPASAHKCTPIQLKATAGLRLLGKERADAILDAVYTLFRQYPFVVTSRDSVIVMDGKDEGPFAWMTVNFLLKSLNTNPDTKTAAIIDMGGASTQIVFRPDDESVMDSVAAERTFNVATEGYNTRIYTHSHLGYGLKQAAKRMMQAARDDGEENAFACFPKGTSEKIDGVAVANTDGAPQSFEKCHAIAERILNKKKACPTTSCSFNGVPQPALLSSFTGSVYAFSYFFDRMEAFLGPEGGVSSVGELRQMAENVCGGSTEAKYADHNKGTMCMDLSYLYAILKSGYDMPDDTKLHIRKKINGIETAWTLGAMMAAMKA